MFSNRNLKVRITTDEEESSVAVIEPIEIATTEEQTKLKLRMGNDYEITNSLRVNSIGEPQELLNEQYLLTVKRKIIKIFLDKEMIQDSLDVNNLLVDINERLMPLISKYLIYVLSINKIYSHALNMYMNEIASLIYGYVKLEFMYHSLVFSNVPIKNQIDDIMEEIINSIHGYEA